MNFSKAHFIGIAGKGMSATALLLRQMGIEPQMWLGGGPTSYRFQSLAEAVELCRSDLGEAWDGATGRAVQQACVP